MYNGGNNSKVRISDALWLPYSYKLWYLHGIRKDIIVVVSKKYGITLVGTMSKRTGKYTSIQEQIA